MLTTVAEKTPFDDVLQSFVATANLHHYLREEIGTQMADPDELDYEAFASELKRNGRLSLMGRDFFAHHVDAKTLAHILSAVPGKEIEAGRVSAFIATCDASQWRQLNTLLQNRLFQILEENQSAPRP